VGFCLCIRSGVVLVRVEVMGCVGWMRLWLVSKVRLRGVITPMLVLETGRLRIRLVGLIMMVQYLRDRARLLLGKRAGEKERRHVAFVHSRRIILHCSIPADGAYPLELGIMYKIRKSFSSPMSTFICVPLIAHAISHLVFSISSPSSSQT
jgi:hypothetical protein